MCTKPTNFGSGVAPCGQCAECRRAKARQWSIRMSHEALSHENNCFVTLTYADRYLPRVIGTDGNINPTLKKVHLKKFIKDLRNELQKTNERFRYFSVGEYGLEGERAIMEGNNPHYHLLIFGQYFEPDKIHKSSPLIQKLWTYGFNKVGFIQEASISYVAGYVQKKLNGSFSQAYKVDNIEPEFAFISKGSRAKKDIGTIWEKGLGYYYFKNNIEPIFKNDLGKDHIWYAGKKIGLPKYYKDKIYKEYKDGQLVYKSKEHEAYSLALLQKYNLDVIDNKYKLKERYKDKPLQYDPVKDQNRQRNINILKQQQIKVSRNV